MESLVPGEQPPDAQPDAQPEEPEEPEDPVLAGLPDHLRTRLKAIFKNACPNRLPLEPHVQEKVKDLIAQSQIAAVESFNMTVEAMLIVYKHINSRRRHSDTDTDEFKKAMHEMRDTAVVRAGNVIFGDIKDHCKAGDFLHANGLRRKTLSFSETMNARRKFYQPPKGAPAVSGDHTGAGGASSSSSSSGPRARQDVPVPGGPASLSPGPVVERDSMVLAQTPGLWLADDMDQLDVDQDPAWLTWTGWSSSSLTSSTARPSTPAPLPPPPSHPLPVPMPGIENDVFFFRPRRPHGEAPPPIVCPKPKARAPHPGRLDSVPEHHDDEDGNNCWTLSTALAALTVSTPE